MAAPDPTPLPGGHASPRAPWHPQPGPTRPPWSWAHAVQQLGLVLAAVVFTVLAGEFVCQLVDGGASSGLHLYRLAHAPGVELRPGSHQRHRDSGGRVTDVRIDAAGRRDGASPPVARGVVAPVLMVGDGQVFGLGVEASETASARLAEQLHQAIENAGVPAYGPRDYLAVVRAALARQPDLSAVVVVLDLGSDLDELDSMLLGRSTVVRGRLNGRAMHQQGPAFLAGEWLAGSHLLDALQRLDRPAHDGGGPGETLVLQQLAGRTRAIYDNQAADDPGPARKRFLIEQARAEALRSFWEAAWGMALDPLVVGAHDHETRASARAVLEAKNRDSLGAPECRPTSIHDPYDAFRNSLPLGERLTTIPPCPVPSGTGGRAPSRAATWMMTADNERKVRDRVAHPDPSEWSEVRLNRAHIVEALDQRDWMARHAHELSLQPWHELSPAPSVFEPWLREMVSLTHAHGVRLVVALVPLRSQAKQSPVKGARPTFALTDAQLADVALADLSATADSLHLRMVDPRPELAAVGPGAYQPDGHLTAAGQSALARALAPELRKELGIPDVDATAR